MNKRVAVALSGGVDSLAAAFLIKEQAQKTAYGYEVMGIHYTTGFESEPADMDQLADQLNIPVHTVDLSQAFEKEVVRYFIQTYQSGRTPNPCLICNRRIKFGHLLKAARHLGATHLATGHYARISSDPDGRPRLLQGRDTRKDQSYFLSLLTPEQLAPLIFPLGGMYKSDILNLAEKNGLSPLNKKESQDICFIPSQGFGDFIASRSVKPMPPGDIVTREGRVVGRHQGLHRYTVGQRRGLNCPGPAPYYVIRLDMDSNRLVVGFKAELTTGGCTVCDCTWQTPTAGDPILHLTVRIRYNHAGVSARVMPKPGRHADVFFDSPQMAVTPGQGAVFYDGDRVVGAGIIQ